MKWVLGLIVMANLLLAHSLTKIKTHHERRNYHKKTGMSLKIVFGLYYSVSREKGLSMDIARLQSLKHTQEVSLNLSDELRCQYLPQPLTF